MSFLPHGSSKSMVWVGSLAASAIMHIFITAFVLFSGVIVFLRTVENLDEREPSFEITFEILDFSTIDAAIPIEEISDDKMAVVPDELETAEPNQTFEALAPVFDTLLPGTETTLTSNTDTDEISPEFNSEISVPEFFAVDNEEVEISSPELIEPEILKSQGTENQFIEMQPIKQENQDLKAIEPKLSDLELEPNFIEMDAKIVKSDPLQKPEIIATEPTKQESQDLKVIEPEFSDLEGEPSFIETDPKGTLSEFTDNQEGMVTEPTTTTEQPTPQSIIVENLSFADELALSPLADSESLLVQPDVLKEDANELALLSPETQTGLSSRKLKETLIAPTLLPEPETDQSITSEVALVPEFVQEPVSDAGIERLSEQEIIDGSIAEALAPPKQQPIFDDDENFIDELASVPDAVVAAIEPDIVMPTPLLGFDEIEGIALEQDGSNISQGSGVTEVKKPKKTEDAGVISAFSPPQILSEPTVSDISIGKLLRIIRTLPQKQCTLALPRRTAGVSGAGVSLIGADSEQLKLLGQSINEGLDFKPELISEIVDPRQCPVLDALRQSNSYPANRIGLSLESSELQSGNSLRGSVIGAGGLYLTLLLIDDNGVVQDVAPFVTLDGPSPVFDAPVARSGSARTTRQILVALGTRDETFDFSSQIGYLAQEVFTMNSAEQLQQAVFGVATFDLQ